MPPKKNRNNKGGLPGAALGAFLVVAVIIAFFRGTGATSAGDVYRVFADQTVTVEQFVDNLIGGEIFSGGNSNGGNGGSGGGSGNDNGGSGGGSGSDSGIGDAGGSSPTVQPSEASEIMESITISAPNNVDYDRSEWSHWDNVRSCWTVRDEVLYRQAVERTLVDSGGEVVDSYDDACGITEGLWVDPFTGDEFTNPSEMDLDHVVALGYAARHGGNDWSSERKRAFANDLEPGHLIMVSASANRSKGDKGPAEWRPSREEYHCEYALAWVSVVSNYELTVTQADHDTLEEMLETC